MEAANTDRRSFFRSHEIRGCLRSAGKSIKFIFVFQRQPPSLSRLPPDASVFIYLEIENCLLFDAPAPRNGIPSWSKKRDEHRVSKILDLLL